MRLFWWVVILYSMIVLTWIYVFQFEDILDKWQNATGMTDSQYVTLLLSVLIFYLFIRPLAFVQHTDVACCCTCCGMVCLSVGQLVGWSVGLFVRNIVIYAKTAEPIEVQFGVWTLVGSSNNVLDRSLYPPEEGAILGWGKGQPIVKYRDHEA